MTESSLDLDYNQAGFGGRLAWGERPALVLVDPVLAYINPESPLYAGQSAQDALTAMITLRSLAHRLAIPVVLTGVRFQRGGIDGGLFFKKVPALKLFETDSPMAAFPEALSPAPSDIIIMKNYASAFFATSLASTLNALKVDSVFIGGFSTSGCVRATALDAMQCGFAPFVVRQACADRDPRPHEANLFDLQAKYAEVIELDVALAQLQSR
ncbi:isochorismatase family protein [Candidatus Phycosocius spiralis]|uniref:N-carbamoylsarcosine amidase n=1 Tax=Candidatus Phycosocius spiralis TaxID=2815099 RepID=A0ABQ4PV59_9PROT|nr:isochorismatase family protein [Candidatus Phycosocius spiralis]GIU66856.1 N-carbamoylsarcosine amidase [Candidatus Phycosocius spiralis]